MSRYVTVTARDVRDVRKLDELRKQVERQTSDSVREINMVLERLGSGVRAAEVGLAAVPEVLTDLDTTVTGAELDAKHRAGVVVDLGLTVSASYVQAEIQALSNKVDELLGVLRAAAIVTAGDFLLLESGDFFLLENGDRFVLE